MVPLKKAAPCRTGVFFESKVPQAMEERVNDDDVGVQTIDARRNDEIETKTTDAAIPRAEERIQKNPGQESQEMRTGDGRNFVPGDGPGAWRVCDAQLSNDKALDALSIEMNLAMLFVSEALQHLGEGALRAMRAVNEW
jgi:hypothetical protein